MRGRLAALALTLGLLLTGCAAGERASASEFAPEEGERLVVTTCDAVCRRTPPPEELRGGCRTLREGEEVDAA